MRVLITRPQFDAARTAEKLHAAGYQTLIDSVIEIEPVLDRAPEGDFSALAFTSANAVRMATRFETLKGIPVFAVGTRTAATARECGFLNVANAAGDVNALAELISAGLPRDARVLHLAGENLAGDLPGALARAGIVTVTSVVYRAKSAGALKPETVEAFRERRLGAVLHYSERSAAIFVRLAEAAGILEDIRKTRHLCLSNAVAAPLSLVGVDAKVAPAPDEEALLALLEP